MKTHIETGFIHPRDYGVVVGSRYDKFFFSPFKYALAKLMLETPQEINTRLEKFADENSYNKKETKAEFRRGVKRKEKLTRLIDMSRRDFLFNTALYNRGFTAESLSKSDKTIPPYRLLISEPSIINIYDEFQPGNRRCDCADSYWGEAKNKKVNCMHLSALELALEIDNKTKESIENNLTGLYPQERLKLNVFPFVIGLDSSLDLLLTESLWRYYVENQKQVDINKFLLDNPNIYSEKLISMLNNSRFDKVRYEVLRQEEQSKLKRDLTESERRFYAASNALEERIYKKLKSDGYTFGGYCLEFKGTKDEVVGKRFQNRDRIISIIIQKDMPPIMIKKHLDDKIQNSFGYISKPLSFDFQVKKDIDDVTRREVLTQVFIPGEKKGSDIFVPEILKERYAKLK